MSVHAYFETGLSKAVNCELRNTISSSLSDLERNDLLRKDPFTNGKGSLLRGSSRKELIPENWLFRSVEFP